MNKSHRHLKNWRLEDSASNQRLLEMQQLVQQTLGDESLITQTVAATEAESEESWGNKMADRVAEFGGSWKFIIGFMSFLLLWIVVNSLFLWQKPFDPYPFILLNLILSCLAAIQAPIIMMSQNRQEAKDRERARNDYAINLKAEIEIQQLHEKMNCLLEEVLEMRKEMQAKKGV